MQCSRCGTSSFDGSLYCGNCGARFDQAPGAPLTPADQPGVGNEETQLASAQIGLQPGPVSPTISVEPAPVAVPPSAIEPAPVMPDQPVYAQPFAPVPPGQPVYAPPAQMMPGISGTSGWAEFGTAPAPGQPMSSGIYPPPTFPAGYPTPYSYPGAPAPTFSPSGVQPPYMPLPPTPVAPPRRKWPVFISGLGVGVLLALILGGVIIGLRANPTPNTTAVATALPTTAITPTPTVADGNRLYQQVTGRSPSIADSLQDASVSPWGEISKPDYGCQMKSDGLHIYIKIAHEFYHCTSGYGSFANFAFQVTAQMTSGDGGGIIFRADTSVGNMYFFHITPGGRYLVSTEQNHKFGHIIASGVASSSPINYGTKFSLTVIAQDSTLYLYFNQQLINVFQDATYSSGYIGVAADDNNSPAETVFTNAQIWKL